MHDVDGNVFIDWTSGVLVANVGHCHPRLVEAVREAAGKILNCYEYANEYRVAAAEALVQTTPEHLDRCFFLSTGSEATEQAIRLMKRYTGCFEIVGFHGAFHGRTPGAAGVGGMSMPKKGYGPPIAGAIHAPYPYCYRCAFKSTPEKCGLMCLEFLDEVVRANSCGSLAGVLAEPYLGTAGFIFPPDGWLTELERWARAHGIMFSLDEVQSSYGRTGKMWAMEWENVTPDIVCLGKGIGSGVPTSAVLMKSSVVGALGPGEMSSTAGGNPLSSAAVIAVLEVMKSERLPDNARKIGNMMKECLTWIAEQSRCVGDVRGKGLVMGLEIVADKNTKEPTPELAKEIIVRCANNGLLVGRVGIFGNVIRVGPPLVINEEEAEESLDIMEGVLLSL
ncbi:MAG: aspartate aminotransferase family protein [Armatimonadetes bacterium]|nr:aspartate aminotransferase family protein [Armatimonadota bacterium]